MVGGGHPLVEDDLRWKMTFDGRQPLVKDEPYGRWSLMEDNL